MVSDLERLTFLGIDPARLEPAPEHPTRADWWPRIDIHSPERRCCCSCRALAVATRVVDVPGLGQRWHDQCRDCMVVGVRLDWEAGRPMAGRHRVTLTLGGRPAVQGWWDDRATAEQKYRSWIGAHGGRDGASVTLTDEETGTVLTSWPDEP